MTYRLEMSKSFRGFALTYLIGHQLRNTIISTYMAVFDYYRKR